MKNIGILHFAKRKNSIVLTVSTSDLEAGLTMKPLFGIRSMHFGTKLRGYDIKKGQGYGWDGKDYIRAKRKGAGVWEMVVPVRDNDPKKKTRRFIKGNAYIRTNHNEIIYFDLRAWKAEPVSALRDDGKGNRYLEIDVEDIF